MKNYYDLLKVGRDAGQEELDRAFERAKQAYQPFLNSADLQEKQAAMDLIIELTAAHQTLSDPAAREAYDKELAAAAGGQAQTAEAAAPETAEAATPVTTEAAAASEGRQGAGLYYLLGFWCRGRIGRLRFLGFSLPWGMFAWYMFGSGGFTDQLSGTDFDYVPTEGIVLVVAIYAMIILWGLSLAIRRLHDMNRSGWLSLLMLVPIINIGLGVWLLLAPGTKGPNDYGPEKQKGFTFW